MPESKIEQLYAAKSSQGFNQYSKENAYDAAVPLMEEAQIRAANRRGDPVKRKPWKDSQNPPFPPPPDLN